MLTPDQDFFFVDPVHAHSRLVKNLIKKLTNIYRFYNFSFSDGKRPQVNQSIKNCLSESSGSASYETSLTTEIINNVLKCAYFVSGLFPVAPVHTHSRLVKNLIKKLTNIYWFHNFPFSDGNWTRLNQSIKNCLSESISSASYKISLTTATINNSPTYSITGIGFSFSGFSYLDLSHAYSRFVIHLFNRLSTVFIFYKLLYNKILYFSSETLFYFLAEGYFTTWPYFCFFVFSFTDFSYLDLAHAYSRSVKYFINKLTTLFTFYELLHNKILYFSGEHPFYFLAGGFFYILVLFLFFPG